MLSLVTDLDLAKFAISAPILGLLMRLCFAAGFYGATYPWRRIRHVYKFFCGI